MRLRKTVLMVLAAAALCGCRDSKPTFRYSGFGPLAPLRSYAINGQGDVLVKQTDGGKTIWKIIHPGKPEVVITNVPDKAVLLALSDDGTVAGSMPVGACAGPKNCPHQLFLLAGGTLRPTPVLEGTAFRGFFDGSGVFYGQYWGAPLLDSSQSPCWHAFTFAEDRVHYIASPPDHEPCSTITSLTGSGLGLVSLSVKGADWNQTYVLDREKLIKTDTKRVNRFWTSYINPNGIVTGTVRPHDPSPKGQYPVQWNRKDGALTDVAVPPGRECEGLQTFGDGVVLARCEEELSLIKDGKVQRLADAVDWAGGHAPAKLTTVWRLNDRGDMVVSSPKTSGKTDLFLLLRK